MKAAVIEKYGSITFRDLPTPVMGEYDALCELLFGATCSGTDTHLIEGHAPFCHWVKPPFILGHESVGRVLKVGTKVRNYRPGDLVTRVGAPGGPGLNVGWGGFAEMGLAKDHWAMAAAGLPASEWSGHRVNQVVPAGVDPTVAPMFTTWRETLSASLRLGVTAGTAVLVAGSGGNGLSFTAHARNLGASCVAMVGARRLEAAAKAKGGVQHYVDYKETDLAGILNKVHPEGFDFIIDAVGKNGTANRVLPCLKPGGRYLTYGVDDFGAVTFNAAGARGAFTIIPCSYDEAETHQQISEAVLQGKLDASLWYDAANPYPLARISEAFAAVKNRESVKVLVRLRG